MIRHTEMEIQVMMTGSVFQYLFPDPQLAGDGHNLFQYSHRKLPNAFQSNSFTM